MTWWKSSYNPILDDMLINLKRKYPDVTYHKNRVEFWYNDGKNLVPQQYVRDAFPIYVDKDTRTMIAGWKIAEMNISPNPLKKYLKRTIEIPSLQTLSMLQLSTYELKIAREIGVYGNT
jgi:hypothetical protein